MTKVGWGGGGGEWKDAAWAEITHFCISASMK